MTELIGQALGSYQLEALLGAGPAGPRYAARHVRLQRPASVRLFTADLSARPDGRRRLLGALRKAAALAHPQIVEVFDVGEEGGRLFVAAELLAGGTLRGLLQRHRRDKTRLPLGPAVALARQAADGVAFAHAQGIVHGSLSPEAMRLSDPGDTPALKLDEFGVAAVFPEEAAAVPAYLTPEQCRGLPLDARSDVYALGVLLYELTVGAPPFNVATVEQATEKHLRTRPVPPRAVRPQLPATLESVILRCLAKAPEDRFANAGELAEALRQIQAALPAPPITTAAPAAKAPTLPLTPQRAELAQPPQQPPPPAPPAPGPPAIPPLPPLDDDDPLLTGLLGATPPQGTPALPPTTPPMAPPFQPPPAYTPPYTPPPPAEPARQQPYVEERVDLEVDQAQVTIAPGRPNFVSVRVINGSTAADAFALSVEGVPGAWLRDIDIPVRLGPGQSAVVPIVVEVPPGGRGEAGDYSVLIRARAVGNRALAGSVQMWWSVLPYTAASMVISPQYAEGRTEAEYTITLRNEGNAAATFLLSADDRGRILGYELGEEELTLGPGQAARIPLIVEVAAKTFGEPDEIPFAVFAEPDSGEAVVAEATFSRRTLMPAWVPALAGFLLVVVLGAGIWLTRDQGAAATQPTATAAAVPTVIPTPLPGAPIVAAFTVNPSVSAPGEVVQLFWDVRGAERVTIDQFGDVPPLGQRDFRPEQTTDFRLVAVAAGRETIAIQRVLVAPPTPTVGPTLAPTLVPTEVPPTAIPPTEVLPTAIPPTEVLPTAIPPTEVPPTAIPPTEVPPTAIPPTEVPPPTAALPTAIPVVPTPEGQAAPTVINLVDRAPGALWSTDASLVRYGRPAQSPEAGGWGDVVREVALEDGSVAPAALLTIPPAAASQQAAAPFVEARYAIPQLPAGQFFLASVGFAQQSASPGLTALITFNGELLYEGQLLPDGQLTPISADMARFAGQSGQLIIRVTAAAGPSPDGLYWLQPRIALPQ
jgi:serine/threonine protein kinase